MAEKLNIGKASIGVDTNELRTAISKLKTEVIDSTITAIKGAEDEIKAYVDNAWIGKSAERFKSLVSQDVLSITWNLNNSFDELTTNLKQTAESMKDAESEIVIRGNE